MDRETPSDAAEVSPMRPALGNARLELFGTFRLVLDGQEVAVSSAGQRVLAYVALADRAVPRRRLAGALWPEVPDGRAAANLRTVVWRLKARCPTLLVCSPMALALHPRLETDVSALREQVRIQDDGLPRLDDDLLPDWWEEWVVIERERFRQLRLHALEELANRLKDAGDFAAAIDAGLRAIAAEPLRETAHRTLIEIFLAEGNRAEAIRQFERLRELYETELGIEPSMSMQRLLAVC